MKRNSTLVIAMAMLAVGAFWALSATTHAQEGQDGGRRGRQQRQQREIDPEAMRERMEEMRRERSERQREILGFSAEDWEVVEPRIQRIEQLRATADAGGRARFGGRGAGQGFRGRRGDDNAEVQREVPETVQEVQALRELLEDEQAGNDAIKAQLAKVREARDNARKELADAREDLRALVTLRQEAQLVATGVLE